jgi:hypothetical protein
VAYALSRIHSLALSTPHMEFIDKPREQLMADVEFQKFLSKVQLDPAAYQGFQILNGLLFFKGKFFLPNSSPLKLTLLEEFHMHLLLEVIVEFIKPLVGYKRMFFGLVCAKMLRILLKLVLCVNKLNLPIILHMDCCNHFPFQIKYGKTFHLILL